MAVRAPLKGKSRNDIRVIPGPLPPVGSAIVHGDGSPAFGLRRGVPARFDYSRMPRKFRRNPIAAYWRHRKWFSTFTATDSVLLSVGVTTGGPATSASLLVVDRATGRILANVFRPAFSGPLTCVSDRPLSGHNSRFLLPGTSISIDGDDREIRVRATVHRLPYVPLLSRPWIELDLRIATAAHDGVTAVDRVPGDDLVTATAKNAALPTVGEINVHGPEHTDEFTLSGVGGFDYTNGFAPRQFHRCWAHASGELADGRLFGLSLIGTSDDQESVENVAFLESSIGKMPNQVTVTAPEADPMGPWTVKSIDGRVDLLFTPVAERLEGVNVGVARTRYQQPVGHFTGVVIFDGEAIRVDRLPGMIERQDVLL